MNKNTLKAITILAVIILTVIKTSYSQLSQSGANLSPIWGASPFNAGDQASQQLRDPNWGVLPSRQQSADDILGRNLNNRMNQRSTAQMRDMFGNIVATDPNGNILYDAQGRAIIDSLAMDAGGDLGTTPPPPPDDTLDVPLDGGVIMLMLVATGLGFKKRKALLQK